MRWRFFIAGAAMVVALGALWVLLMVKTMMITWPRTIPADWAKAT